jgi:methyl-accepting chemotaxis protein
VVALLIVVNLIFSWWNTLETAEIIAASPQLADQMRATDARSAMLLLAISLVCVGLIVFRSIILTHRTAGASYKIGMRLDQIAAGQHDTELHLRLNDNLRELEEPFNKMSASLRRIAQEDAEALTTIADEIQGQENAALVERLRKLAEAKSSLTE